MGNRNKEPNEVHNEKDVEKMFDGSLKGDAIIEAIKKLQKKRR